MKKKLTRLFVLLIGGWLAYRFLVRGNKTVVPPKPTRRPVWYERLLRAIFDRVNRHIEWHKLPRWLGIGNLVAIRSELRENNLFDPSNLAARSVPQACPIPDLTARRPDGKFNDLEYPEMGSTGEFFGRNFPSTEPGKELDFPNPRLISNELLARKEFIPAYSLNLLAAAWIQFQTHDWFDHGEPDKTKPQKFPLPKGDKWDEGKDAKEKEEDEGFMSFPATPVAKPGEAGSQPLYKNLVSHWWDASAIYGADEKKTRELRTNPGTKQLEPDGKLYLPNGRLPMTEDRDVRTGHTDNWWIGLALLHTVFALEHNAICTRLRQVYPNRQEWDDERIFHTARLIIAALTAKIHTIEWTCAILAHPTLRLAMNGNWYGLAGEATQKLVGRISESELISGIPGSNPDHHGAPFALTEEFVSVYRLHPLIPDSLKLFSIETGQPLAKNGKHELPFEDIAFRNAQAIVDDPTLPDPTPAKKPSPMSTAAASNPTGTDLVKIEDVFYSFGIAHPGKITLQNYPQFLRDLRLPNGRRLDLAATDIFRDRERQIPRYNTFRKMVHRPPVRTFEELTPNAELAAKIKEIYEGDIDSVDLLVGLLAEEPPEGYGFSDTAFRVFILMASRRLKSDRFFTTDYREEVYTKVGLDWIEQNTMSSVLLRHFPALAPALRGIDNAFAPWNRLG